MTDNALIASGAWFKPADKNLWENLPTEEIPVDRRVLWDPNEHPVSHRHVRGLIDDPDPRPIHVEQLHDGKFYVLDGRHRFTRAWLDGRQTIKAKVLRHTCEH